MTTPDDRAAMTDENEALMKALAACRDAAFSEPITSQYFDSAMADPLEVPAYVKDQFDSLRAASQPQPVNRAAEIIERGRAAGFSERTIQGMVDSSAHADKVRADISRPANRADGDAVPVARITKATVSIRRRS